MIRLFHVFMPVYVLCCWRWAFLLLLPAVMILGACAGENEVSLKNRLMFGAFFNGFDADGDGVLTGSDFTDEERTYSINGKDKTAAQAKAFWFGLCDGDGDDQLMRDEFITCLDRLDKQEQEPDLPDY